MKNNKTNITFILPSLVPGGAERVMSYIAQHIDNSKFNTTLLVIGFESESAYKIEGIKVIYLNKSRVLNGIPKLFSYVFKKNPTIVVSCMSHLNTAMAFILLFFPKIKLVARESNIKTPLEGNDTRMSLVSRTLIKLSSRLIDILICQSQDMADSMVKELHFNQSKIIIINNPISGGFERKSEEIRRNSVVQYITVGRLKKIKGYLRLLNVLSKIEHPFHYTFIGDGDEYNAIMNYAKELHIDQYITHLKFTKKVSEHLKQSDLFLQGSYAEGFPNALLESCAVGTPALAFNAPGGTKEIIKDGVNGYLAEDENEFIRYLNHIHNNNPFEPETVSKHVYEKFDKNIILKKYEDVFLQLVKK